MALLVQAILHHQSGLPEDDMVNTFHFTGGVDGTTANSRMGAVVEFYTTMPANETQPLAAFLSPAISRGTGGLSLKAYDTTVAGQGPVLAWDYAAGLTAAGGTGLPSEVAVCLSYRSGGATGDQGARQRGRLFFGPLNTLAIAVDGIGVARPSANLIDALLDAGERLHVATGGNWVVHSTYGSAPGSNPPSVQTDYPIDFMHVDDSFDTQRRRGEGPTTRTSRILT